jgi:hypothetical protein
MMHLLLIFSLLTLLAAHTLDGRWSNGRCEHLNIAVGESGALTGTYRAICNNDAWSLSLNGTAHEDAFSFTVVRIGRGQQRAVLTWRGFLTQDPDAFDVERTMVSDVLYNDRGLVPSVRHSEDRFVRFT